MKRVINCSQLPYYRKQDQQPSNYAGDEQKVNKILQKFENYCKPRKNITWEQHVFNTWNQQTGEPIYQYVTDLKIKAPLCEFDKLHDNLIHNQIVCNIICDKTRGRLIREGDITLQKAVDICRAAEGTTQIY